MTSTDAREIIVNAIKVTRLRVSVMKRMLLQVDYRNIRTLDAIDKVMIANEWVIPPTIHESVASPEMLNQVGEAIGWRLCAVEAIWELIHDSVLIPTNERLEGGFHDITWSHSHGGGGLGLPNYISAYPVQVPAEVRMAGSWRTTGQMLADADLYLQELNIDGIHSEVEEALRDAVTCFRHYLFTPCLAMLSKACEGAWIEMGLALTRAVSQENADKGRSLARDLGNRNTSLRRKLQLIMNFYERPGLCEAIQQASNVNHEGLRCTWIWTDTVRESRNAIHYGTEAPLPNTYEKVATLLLSAVSNFRLIYAVCKAASSVEQARASSSGQ